MRVKNIILILILLAVRVPVIRMMIMIGNNSLTPMDLLYKVKRG